MSLTQAPSDAGLSQPAVRQLSWDRPFFWLKAGWQDLKANPLPSLAYGILFGLGGDLIILALVGRPHLLTVAISGFFLIAPLLAAGLYELSRRTAKGEKILFIDSVLCFRRNGKSLALFGLSVAIAIVLWERFSAIAFGLLGSSNESDTAAYLSKIVLSGEYNTFVAIWFVLGGLLALVVFAFSVVSVPLMLDRNTDFITAMKTSFCAFATNRVPLLLWGAIIVLLTLTGFATFLFGLLLIMPILGHASWHAYKELVE